MRALVAVVGGGITGLAAAHTLTSSRPDLDVVVLETSARVGGKLVVGEVGGVELDLGAEALLNRRREAVDLAREVGLGADVCHPETTGSGIWTRDGVRPMPATVMGVPADLPQLWRSGVVSRRGVARAAADLVLPSDGSAGDVSVGRFVGARLGAEVVERLVEPLLGGVYAGHASQLSLQAAAAQIAALADRHRSLLRAAREARPRHRHRLPPVFAGVRGGVGRLPAAVSGASGATVRTGTTVRGLTRRDRWELLLGSSRAPETLVADAVVLATPAPAAARLLGQTCPSAAAELEEIRYASTAVVTLAIRSATLPVLAGTGFLVPPVDARVIKAVTYSGRKWGWLQRSAGSEMTMLRASIGRLGDEALLQRDDSELVELARSDLGTALGRQPQLVDAAVTRWGGALPQYAVGHRSRVERIRAAVAAAPRLEVCGAAYDGIGVAACIADGQRAAGRLLVDLAAARGLST